MYCIQTGKMKTKLLVNRAKILQDAQSISLQDRPKAKGPGFTHCLPLWRFLCSPHAHNIAVLDKYREITVITSIKVRTIVKSRKKPFELFNFPTISFFR